MKKKQANDTVSTGGRLKKQAPDTVGTAENEKKYATDTVSTAKNEKKYASDTVSSTKSEKIFSIMIAAERYWSKESRRKGVLAQAPGKKLPNSYARPLVACYGKNSVKIIINPESLTGLRDLFCALLYAIILTSCSFSDK